MAPGAPAGCIGGAPPPNCRLGGCGMPGMGALSAPVRSPICLALPLPYVPSMILACSGSSKNFGSPAFMPTWSIICAMASFCSRWRCICPAAAFMAVPRKYPSVAPMLRNERDPARRSGGAELCARAVGGLLQTLREGLPETRRVGLLAGQLAGGAERADALAGDAGRRRDELPRDAGA